MSERARFVVEWEKRWKEARGGRVDVAELCRAFGVSRQTGYVWLRRFQAAGHDVRALEDRSRRPHTSPTAVPVETQDFIVQMRKQRPRWGPRALRAWLVDRHPGRQFPSASTFAAILKRNGLTTPRRRRRRRRVPQLAAPLGIATAANAIWCIDFKGDFCTADGIRCYPLTVVDAFSRFCIRCEALAEPTGRWVEYVLDSAFREFGLPAAIRSDNGPPFAASGPAGLSALAVWLLRLGIRLERIAPGKPQQNGRQERFHRTLKEATASPPQRSLRTQQRAFDLFRREYNEERPHAALALKPPASTYMPSTRRYPCGLLAPSVRFHDAIADRHGAIKWGGQRIFVSSALAGQRLSLDPIDGSRWTVSFGSVELGHFDQERIRRGLVVRHRSRRPHFLELSSPD